MRKEMLLIVAAVIFGLAGGYAWSVMNAPPVAAPKPAKAAMIALPASPEERPEALDREWTAEADDHAAATGGVHYAGCNAVRAAGKAPLHQGQPGYSQDMDGDDDGIACEPVRNHKG